MTDTVIFINTSDQSDSHIVLIVASLGTQELVISVSACPKHAMFSCSMAISLVSLFVKQSWRNEMFVKAVRCQGLRWISHQKAEANMVGGLKRWPSACFYHSETTVHVTFLLPVSIVFTKQLKRLSCECCVSQ